MKKSPVRLLILVLIASLMLACNLNSFKLNAPKIEKEIEKQIEKMDDQQGKEDDNGQGKGKDDAPGQNKDKSKSSHESGEDEQNNDIAPEDMPFNISSGEYPDEFPVTDDAANLMVIGEGEGMTVNYQTQMPIDEAAQWISEMLASRGLQENGQLTVISDATFSMVFTGSDTGMDLVVQGVKLDTSLTNINVRYEK